MYKMYFRSGSTITDAELAFNSTDNSTTVPLSSEIQTTVMNGEIISALNITAGSIKVSEGRSGNS